MSHFHSLVVSEVTPLTPSSVAVTFDIPEALQHVFAFTSGQYITLKKEIDGQELRRAYSICSTPGLNTMTIGVKQVHNGGFSEYANQQLKKGDTLEVMPPEGRFVFSDQDAPKQVAAFAAGSGITPIMSIAKSVIAGHPNSTFVLVYGNTSQEETMFYKDLLRLQEENTDRFFLYFINSRLKADDSLFGRIDRSTINYALQNKHADIQFDSFYLCGPEGMIQTVEKLLNEKGIAKDRIFHELFTATENSAAPKTVAEGKTALEVTVDEETFSFTMDKKMIVLDAVLKEDIDAPYSCQGGVCSSCIAKVTEGKAEMLNNQILTDDEIAEGLILTCQAQALSPTLKIDYDDV